MHGKDGERQVFSYEGAILHTICNESTLQTVRRAGDEML